MKTNIWSSAAVNGMLLALITIIFTLVLVSFPTSGTAAKIFIPLVKLIATVGTLYYFMKAFGQEQESYSYGQAFTYGFVVSFCSSIVIACYYFLHYTLIFPNAMDKELEAAQPYLAQFNVDPAAFDLIVGKFPVIISVSSIIGFTLYGLIFSAILASFAKKAEQPFANETEM